MKYISSLFVFVIATWATWAVAPIPVQAGSGFYLGSELGINFASGPGYDRDQQRPEQRVR